MLIEFGKSSLTQCAKENVEGKSKMSSLTSKTFDLKSMFKNC